MGSGLWGSYTFKDASAVPMHAMGQHVGCQ